MTPEDIRFRSDMLAELVNQTGDDYQVVKAARVSTGRDLLERPDYSVIAGLIRYLMRNRHGTPFEHNSFTFRVECPIFVAREFMRHRIASYNETSGRYTQLKPVFWVPASSRPLVQEGKPGAYTMKPGTTAQYNETVAELRESATVEYRRYERLIDIGVAREVARACLPTSIYTSFYVTMNARAMMNFLSLRIDDPDAAYPSKPQYEIEHAAVQIEDAFAKCMPLTFAAFTGAGRVAP